MRLLSSLTTGIRYYFLTVYYSLTSLNFYHLVQRQHFTWSLRFFLISFFLLTLTQTIDWQVRIFPQLTRRFDQVLSTTEAHYPTELVFRWDGKQLSFSGQDPLVVPYPAITDDRQPHTSSSRRPQTTDLALFTHQSLDRDQLGQFATQALFVVTPTTLFVQNTDGTWASFSLTDALGDTQFVIDKKSFFDFALQAQTYLEIGQPIIVISLFLAALLGSIIQRLFSAVIGAGLIMLVFSMTGIRHRFGALVAVSLQVTCVASLINTIATTGYGILHQPLTLPLFSIAYWVLMVVILYQLQTAQPVVVIRDEDQG